MASKIITAFFTNNGVPQTGLTPTVDIWELHPTIPTTNPQVVTGGAVTEIGGGWYRYDFLTYDSTLDYSIIFDGGVSLNAGERYHVAGNESYSEDIWNQTASSSTAADTMGLLQNQTAADSALTNITLVTAISLLELLLKYDRNRTAIDKTLMTLTVYDDDGVTPLTVFNLLDGTGTPSVAEVCIRDPQ